MMNNIVCRLLNRIKYFKNRTVILNRKFHNVKWKIPILNETGYQFSFGLNTEPWIYNLLNNINSKEKITTFIDVGVNIGQTLIKVKSIQPNVSYIGFDPSIQCISYVQYLQKLNNLKDITLLAVGLSESIDLLTLRSYGEIDSRASFSDLQVSDAQASFTTIAPVFTLDYILKDKLPEQLTILKIDVEGFEFSVLKGSTEFLKNSKPIIIFEVLPHHNIIQKMENSSNLFAFLVENSYSIFHINVSTNELTEVNTFIENENNYLLTDFVAVCNLNHKSLLEI